LSPGIAGSGEMPLNGAFFCPFPPMSQPRLRRTDGTFNVEETVEKLTFLSEGYDSRAKGREELDRRYRKIGISAVAAAVRYQGKAESVADARNDDQAETESAA